GADGTDTTFSGTIGGTGGLAKIGTGSFTLAGGGANSYTGTTTAAAGTLLLGKTAGADAIPGPLVVGTGSGGGAIARWLADDQVDDASSVTVNGDGLLDLNGRSDTTPAVTVRG